MKNYRRYILLGIIALFAVIWTAGFIKHPGNPKERHTGIILSPAADPLLKRACFDCHSNETEYPWYSRLPLTSILIARHVKKGRRELNFSHWDRKDEAKRARAFRKIARELRKNRMPPKDYMFINAKARMTEEELALLLREAEAKGGPAPKSRSEKKNTGNDLDEEDNGQD